MLPRNNTNVKKFNKQRLKTSFTAPTRGSSAVFPGMHIYFKYFHYLLMYKMNKNVIFYRLTLVLVI